MAAEENKSAFSFWDAVTGALGKGFEMAVEIGGKVAEDKLTDKKAVQQPTASSATQTAAAPAASSGLNKTVLIAGGVGVVLLFGGILLFATRGK